MVIWCGIVKNEVKALATLLPSLKPFLTGLCVVDTWSTDDTEKNLRAFAEENEIPCSIPKRPFDNFGDSRTHALRMCEAFVEEHKLENEWVLLMDADMEWVGRAPEHGLLEGHKIWHVVQKTNTLDNYNVRLVHASVLGRCEYKGFTHEYLDCGGLRQGYVDPKVMRIKEHPTGSNRVNKFQRDERLLKKELSERTVFYLANTYRDQFNSSGANAKNTELAEKAIRLYRVRADIEAFTDERYVSCLYTGRLLKQLGRPDEAVFVWQRAIQLEHRRPEAYLELCKQYMDKKEYHVAAMYLDAAKRDSVDNKHFLFYENRSMYNLGLQRTICYYWINRLADGYQACVDMWYRYWCRYSARNLQYYVRRCPGTCFKLGGKHPPEENWHYTNPSVCAFNGELWVNLRMVNYAIKNMTCISKDDDGKIRTKNALFRVGVDNPYEWLEEHVCDVKSMEDIKDNPVLGYEDLRPFVWEGSRLDAVGTYPVYKNGKPDYHIVWLQDVMNPSQTVEKPLPKMQGVEKNWCPWVLNGDKGGVNVAYDSKSYFSLNEFEKSGKIELKSCNDMPEHHKSWRGSSQLVPWEDGQFIHIVHEVLVRPDRHRIYYHRFIVRDSQYRVVKGSQLFYFRMKNTIEFCAGLARQGSNFVITFGHYDKEAWGMVSSKAEIEKFFEG